MDGLQVLKIRSDGTSTGTEISLGGVELPNVVAVTFHIDARDPQLVQAVLLLEAKLDIDAASLVAMEEETGQHGQAVEAAGA